MKITPSQLNKLSEEEQIDLIKKEEWVLLYIKNPSARIILSIIDNIFWNENNPIRHIEMDEDTQLEILRVLSPRFKIEFITTIKNPSVKAILEINKQAGNLSHDYISRLRNISDNKKLELIQAEPYLIQYFQNPSEILQLEAIKGSYKGEIIDEIKNPTKKAQLLAIQRKNYRFLAKIKDVDEEVAVAAVSESMYALKYINNITPKVLDALLKHKYFPLSPELKSVRYVKGFTHESNTN